MYAAVPRSTSQLILQVHALATLDFCAESEVGTGVQVWIAPHHPHTFVSMGRRPVARGQNTTPDTMLSAPV